MDRFEQYAYHRLGRSWTKYRWWKPLVTGAIALAIYGVFSLVLAGVFVGLAEIFPSVVGGFLDSLSTLDLDMSDPVVFVFALSSIALMLPSVLIASRIMGARPLGLLSSVAGRLRWGWLARCIPPALIAYGIVFGFSFLVIDPVLGSAPLNPTITATTWLLVALALVLTPLQATAEEYVFRGFLGQTVGGWLKHPAFAILLPVPLFALGHNYDLLGLIDVAIFAVVAGWLTWRTGGLEAAIVAHVLNNTLLFVLGAFSVVDLGATGGSPIGLLSTVVTMAIYATLVTRNVRRTGLITQRTIVYSAPPLVPVEETVPEWPTTGLPGSPSAPTLRP